MFFGLSAHSVDLLILGGLLVVLVQAASRRDPAWVLAIGLPILLCADHVGVSSNVIDWGYALYALALLVAGLALVMRTLGVPALTSLVASLAGTLLITGAADAHHIGLANPSLHTPPQLGVRLAEWMRTIDVVHPAP
jgi:hypothetical protein